MTATNLRSLPYIGKRCEALLIEQGITSVALFMQQSPDALYARICAQYPGYNRALLYVFRSAQEYSKTGIRTPWWFFKDIDKSIK